MVWKPEPLPKEIANKPLTPPRGGSLAKKPKTHDAFDELYRDVVERAEKRREIARELSRSNRIIRFTKAGMKAIATPDMSEAASYRLSYIGDDGIPCGHSEFKTMYDAVYRALEEGFHPVYIGR